MALALAQGVLAAAIATALRQAIWWLPIHLAFAPLLILATRLQLEPGWYLALFGILLALYGAGAGQRIPLYLSNRDTALQVAKLLPSAPAAHIIDLGAGTGSLLCRLAQQRPDLQFTGIELAPLPYLVGLLRTRRYKNIAWRRADIWRSNLAPYTFAYAFLSPPPMQRLWDKITREMPPGSILVSNSFPVPAIEAQAALQVADRRRTRLYYYRIPPIVKN